ncbi:hypothetical protein [Streptomyces sp. NPDC127038]|uniref:hypothetical protein n=1 Tax=Streptomyces sp. NPDC127038 TaxID=3347114 RepID=UPI00365827EF
MKNPQTEADSRQIFEALTHGCAGDDDTAWSLLDPIVRRSNQAMYATFCALAEAASFDALQNQRPGEHFGIVVENIDTGEAGSIDAFPPGIRFASQFITARANRDEDTADALYMALYRDSPDDLGVGLRALYDMAVVSLRAYVERKRKAEGR